MKNLKIFALSTVLASSLFGIQEQNVDYISMSMGDAGVASSYGSMSAYLNPALVNNKDNKRTEIGISVGVGIQEHELGDDLYRLDEADVSDTIDRIENGEGADEEVKANAKEIQYAIQDLSTKDNYLTLSPTFGVSFKVGRHWSLGVYAMANVKAKAIINGNKLDYIYYDEDNDIYIKYDPNTGNYSTSSETEYNNYSLIGAMDNGETYIDVKGVSITEIPLTYADNFAMGENIINWGISAKYMVGSTTSTQILFTDDDYDPAEKLDENTVDTATFGIDAGIIIQPNDSRFKLAIAGKNLNSPEFDVIDGSTYKLDPKITTGVAYSMTDMLDIEVDYDLLEVTDELTEQKYQYIGGGINFHPLTWFSLRAGAKQNLADEDNYNGTIYTAGMSFGLKWLQIDAAVQASEKSGEYDGEEIPRYVKANIALVSKWGDN